MYDKNCTRMYNFFAKRQERPLGRSRHKWERNIMLADKDLECEVY